MPLQEIACKIAAGERLNSDDVDVVAHVDDLLDLAALADDRRRQLHRNRTTFVRVYEIEMQSAVSTELDVPLGSGEVRIVGTVKHGSEAVAATRHVASWCGEVPVTGFSLDGLAEITGGDCLALTDLLAELKQTGLSLLAEARADRINGTDWFEVASVVGLGIGSITVGNEIKDCGLELARKVVGWGQAVEPVHAFSPLSATSGNQPTTGFDDVRQVALARVLVDNIDSIQVDWQRHGPKLAQVALSFGANDVDRVSPLDTLELGWRRAPLEEIKRNILASALEPVQRNGRFETLEISQ